jgi:hypothetical protein
MSACGGQPLVPVVEDLLPVLAQAGHRVGRALDLRRLRDQAPVRRQHAKDPAAIFAQDGPAALGAVLREDREPLSVRLIDARIDQFEQYLDHTEGIYRAMHSTAALIAELLPGHAARRISQLTGGRKLVLVDDLANLVEIPQLPRIAAALPAETAYQVVRAAMKLGFDATEVTAQVANTVTRDARSQKGRAPARHGTVSAPGQYPAPSRPGSPEPASRFSRWPRPTASALPSQLGYLARGPAPRSAQRGPYRRWTARTSPSGPPSAAASGPAVDVLR